MTATKQFAISVIAMLMLAVVIATPALCENERPRPISPRELFSDVPGAENMQRRPLSPEDIPGNEAWDVPGSGGEADRRSDEVAGDWTTYDFPAQWGSEAIRGEYIPERRDRWAMAGIGMVTRGKYPFMENTTTGYTRPKDIAELFGEMDGETVSRMLTPQVHYAVSGNETHVFVSGSDAYHFFPAYMERSERQGVDPKTDENSTLYDHYRVVSFYGVWCNDKLGRMVRFFDLRLPDWEHRVVWQDGKGVRQTTEWTRSGKEVAIWLNGIATPRNWGRVEHRYSPVASKLIVKIDGREVWRGDYRQIPD